MAGDVQQLDDASDFDWGELEDLLADFAHVAKSDAPFSHVARELVDLVSDALAAEGAAIWLVDASDSLRLEHHRQYPWVDHLPHHDFLRRALEQRRPRATRGGELADEGVAAEFCFLTAPVLVDSRAVGLVEVVHRRDVSNEALEGGLRLIGLLGELAADHLRRSEVRALRGGVQRRRQFDDFLCELHGALDPRQVASILANDGRTLIASDRAAITLTRGRRQHLAAVSAVDIIDRRSAAVQRLERLVERATATGEICWFDGSDRSLPPQIERALQDYLDESHAQAIGILPLHARRSDIRHGQPTGELIGALVVESFNSAGGDFDRPTTAEVARHGTIALTNALRYRSLPTLPFLRFRQRVSGSSSRARAVGAALLLGVAVLLAALWIEVDFKLAAEGELRPAERQYVFAPLDGHVDQVAVAHGEAVEAGQTLVEMSSPELELEIQKIQGEHNATIERSRALESTLLDYRSSIDPELIEVNKLAAEREELRQQFTSQQQRLAALRAERQRLAVASPMTGAVLTWETDRELLNRPVRRGQRLLTVANLDGPWEAELRVRDDQAGPLLAHRRLTDGPLEASFELATGRGEIHQGAVERIAQRTEIDGDEGAIVRVTIQVDRSSLGDPRPGATVFAKIHCGRRTLFDIWCGDLIDRVQNWFSW